MNYCDTSNQIGSFAPSSGTTTQNIITKNIDCVSLEADLVSTANLTVNGVAFPGVLNEIYEDTQYQSTTTTPYATTSFSSSVVAPEFQTSGQITTNTINSLAPSQIVTIGSTTNAIVANTTTGRVGLGTNAPAANLDIAVSGTSGGTFMRCLVPSISSNGNCRFTFGQSTNTKDSGYVDYVHSSTGSSTNQVRLGLTNQSSPLISLNGTTTTITGPLAVTGLTTFSSPIITPSPLILAMNSSASGVSHTLTGLDATNIKQVIIDICNVGVSNSSVVGFFPTGSTSYCAGTASFLGVVQRDSTGIPVVCQGMANSEAIFGTITIKKVFMNTGKTLWTWVVSGNVYQDGGTGSYTASNANTISGRFTNATNTLALTSIVWNCSGGTFNRANSTVHYSYEY